MTKNDTRRSSGWRRRLQTVWEGNKKPSRWLIRIILVFIMYHVVNWLWQNSLLTARWAPPGKSFSLVFAGATVFAVLWMLITIWRLLSSLGGKRVMVLLVALYAFAIGMKLLILPPGQPILPELPGQMANVAKDGANAITQRITVVSKTISEFRFAYTGHRDLIDFPGVDEPEESITGNIIQPNYITPIETLAPDWTPE